MLSKVQSSVLKFLKCPFPANIWALLSRFFNTAEWPLFTRSAYMTVIGYNDHHFITLFTKCSHRSTQERLKALSISGSLIYESESDVTYGQVWWPILGICAFNPSKVHTHSSEHTHTVNKHPEQWAAIYVAAPGSSWGVRCLAQGHLSRGIEGGERALYIHSPTYNSCRTWDSNPRPLGYESDSLTIRPRLPLHIHGSANRCHFQTLPCASVWVLREEQNWLF